MNTTYARRRTTIETCWEIGVEGMALGGCWLVYFGPYFEQDMGMTLLLKPPVCEKEPAIRRVRVVHEWQYIMIFTVKYTSGCIVAGFH